MNGWTLVESLVSLSVLAVLLAITIPVLRGVKEAAISGASLSNIRQNVHQLHSWAVDHDDKVPRAPMQEGHVPPQILFEFPEPTQGFITDYFGQIAWWNIVLHQAGYEPTEAWFRPDANLSDDWRLRLELRPDAFGSDYVLSEVFLADPAHWTLTSNQNWRDWRDIRLSETHHPSVKAMLADRWIALPLHLDHEGLGPIGFADGHGEIRARADATAPVPNQWQFSPGRPLLNTQDGVHGRDF